MGASKNARVEPGHDGSESVETRAQSVGDVIPIVTNSIIIMTTMMAADAHLAAAEASIWLRRRRSAMALVSKIITSKTITLWGTLSIASGRNVAIKIKVKAADKSQLRNSNRKDR